MSTATAVATTALLSSPSTWEEFEQKYRGLAAVAVALHHQDVAAICGMVLGDIEKVRAGASNEMLSLRQAAEESGFHRDHLRRMIRAGQIAVTRDRKHPLIRRADLPKKGAGARKDDVRARCGYSVSADASAIAARVARRSEATRPTKER